ncbi:MAG: FtsX-like permease family protein [Gammaproteobacteria bacterium]|nr:FtsX-like permease family protein [Gammaproteobacteria bacterium]
MFKLAARLAWRDWRGGELQLLLVALLLAITSLTSISLFTTQVQQAMVAEGASLLAADLRLNGSAKIAPQWQQLATERNLQQAQVHSFQGMLFNDELMQLASIKAVSDQYPLKGQLQVSQQAFGIATATQQGPKSGELWLDSRLLASLDAKVGDQIDVGEATLTLTQVLISEPDQSGGFAGFAPRAMMHLNDLSATQAVQTGSRINRSWLLAGSAQQLQDLRQTVTPMLYQAQRWQTPDDANDNLSDTLERAEQFLLLAGSLTVILAGVALVLSARRYSLRQANHVALLKCLGLRPRQLRWLYLTQMLLLALAALLLSLPLAWLLYTGLLALLADYIQAPTGLPLQPFVLGGLTGLLCLLTFVMPPMLGLAKVAPAQALRQAVARSAQPISHLMIGFMATLGLVYWHSQSWLITLGLIAAIGGLLGLLWVLSRSILWLTARMRQYLGQAGKLGIANLHRRRRQNSMQMMIFALALMLLFSLLGVRNFLLSDWQQRLQSGIPNVFMLNIFGEQRDQLDMFVVSNGINNNGLNFYPMTRGRLIYPDPQALSELTRDQPGPRADRERNLTWSQNLPADNDIVAGNWWRADDTDLQVSVELDYATRYGWQLGDQLVYNVAGIEHSATITSLRKVEWGGLQPNFFLIFSKPLTDPYSTTYLASMYVAPEHRPQLSALLRAHPTISMIDVDQILKQVQKVVAQLSMAVESILLLILAAGILVLVASVQASRDERMHESAILRALGANKILIQKMLLIEYITMGIIAGLLASAGAEILLGVLQTRLFDLPLQWHWELWLLAPTSGALLIGLAGWWFNRRVVQAPPLRTLRQI